MNQLIDVNPREDEVFVRVYGYPNYYISTNGRCYNTKTKEFIGEYEENGFVRVDLSNDGNNESYYMHELVMKHFGPRKKPDGAYKIVHINHIRDDNDIFNLKWIDKEET